MSVPPPRPYTLPEQIRETSAPKWKLPRGACDCHAHVFGPQTRFPYVPDAAYIPHDATPADYARMLRAIGCDRAVLVQPSVYGTDNSAMIDALRARVFDFRGVAVVAETITDRELEEMHAAGVRGIRLNLASQTPGLQLAQAPQLAKRIKPLGWHLQFFMDLRKLERAEEKLAALDIDIVIDHFGHVSAEDGVAAAPFQTLLTLVKRDNVWAKLIGPYFLSNRHPHYADVTSFARALVEAAPERVVWGTDWPHPAVQRLGAPMPDDGTLADMIPEWIPDEGLRTRVLVDNPARLYQFS